MLNGKVAVVTGGSSGIGRAIAMRLGREGACVAVVASSDLGKAEATVAEITAAGGSARGYVADVRDPRAVADLMSGVIADFATIDILVTAAGIFVPTPVGNRDATAMDQMIDVNFKGTFHSVNAVAPHMIARGSGRIVCLSSVTGRLGVAGFSAYCASKAAVTMLVQTLALELAPHGININSIAPGNTATAMNEWMRMDPSQQSHIDKLDAITPSRQTFSDPADIAELALFLLSPAARAMHGSSVVIDEGVSAGVSLD